ncbi:hypothetical protein EQ718_01255 [Paracoccus versutus]|uniref:Uncharacterized protein n=1 Tax=Paracoccus versutus TaxID=34007 RepID=A0AAQ0KJQ0_PARVE|nr:hypothetical protein [Paracoccus versutus]REG32689.1 hypothetical protein ATH84_104414 [Paracoccus versutus]WEJ77597.1 hypothetical protein EQ718_01255 [Paracoccus versutus]
MKTKEDVENLEKLTGQLNSLHAEVTALAKKSPSDAVNAFNLKLINKVLELGNQISGDKYRPFSDFEAFDSDDLPSTSDVAMVIGQYIEEAERFRSDNVVVNSGWWYYRVDGKQSDIRSAPPSKIGRK